MVDDDLITMADDDGIENVIQIKFVDAVGKPTETGTSSSHLSGGTIVQSVVDNIVINKLSTENVITDDGSTDDVTMNDVSSFDVVRTSDVLPLEEIPFHLLDDLCRRTSNADTNVVGVETSIVDVKSSQMSSDDRSVTLLQEVFESNLTYFHL
jgi:hypothetical protein